MPDVPLLGRMFGILEIHRETGSGLAGWFRSVGADRCVRPAALAFDRVVTGRWEADHRSPYSSSTVAVAAVDRADTEVRPYDGWQAL